ncbi:MAG: hypothetical protein ABIG37_02445 [Nanoarchaeota archaeon]|nr:hypothetical protein [Nanoarchaeota archaeon]MBU1136610.1 hypothetical protein [Nanoarchaeota archaeon]
MGCDDPKVSSKNLTEACRLFVDTQISEEEIAKRGRFSLGSINYFLNRAQEEGILNPEVRRNASRKRGLEKKSVHRRVKVVGASLDYCFFDDSVKDILKNYNISRNTLVAYLKEAATLGVVSSEESGRARKRRMYGRNHIIPEKLERVLTQIKEETENHIKDSNYKFSTGEEFGRKYGISATALNARLWKLSKDSEYSSLLKNRVEVVKKQASVRSGLKAKEDNTGIHCLPRRFFVEIGKRNALRAKEKSIGIFGMNSEELCEASRKGKLRLQQMRVSGELDRKTIYNIESRFSADSMQEGAVALTLERYLPNFKIKEGGTFQNPGDTTYLYDFVLPDCILEWHPVRLGFDGKRYIPGDYEALRELKKESTTREEQQDLRSLERDLEKEVAVNYWISRQEASDNSDYFKGREVYLAKNPKELYDFLKEKGATTLPDYQEFAKEFKKFKEYVRQFKVVKPEKKREVA